MRKNQAHALKVPNLCCETSLTGIAGAEATAKVIPCVSIRVSEWPPQYHDKRLPELSQYEHGSNRLASKQLDHKAGFMRRLPFLEQISSI